MTPALVSALETVRLVVYALLFDELAARSGAGLLGLLGYRPRNALSRFGTGYLLGLCSLGAAMLGLALAGLLFPSLVAVAAVALVACSREGFRRDSLVAAAVREFTAVAGPAGSAILGLALVVVLPDVLVPLLQQDSWLYHLGAPWQYLVTHKAQFDLTTGAFGFTLPVEMAYTVPILAGDDRLAKCMVASSFLAVAGLFAGRRGAGGTAAWLGPLVALATASALWLVGESKNDMAAASLFLAGALLAEEGSFPAGFALLGLAVSSKYVYGPAAVALMVVSARGRWRALLWAPLLGLASLPWFARDFLAYGKPLAPFVAHGSAFFNWDSRNHATYLVHLKGLWAPDTMAWLALPKAWLHYVAIENLPVLLALPVLFFFRESRWPALAILAGQLVTLRAAHFPRYLLPTVMLGGFMAVRALPRLPGTRARTALMVLVAGWSLFRAGVYRRDNVTLLPDLAKPHASAVKERITSFGEALDIMAPLAPRRVLTVGEWRVYGIPARVVYGGMCGETPFVWKAVNESLTTADVLRKFRQAGARTILYNYAGVKWAMKRYALYLWDERMVRLYREFCFRHLSVAGASYRCEFLNGGFYVYRVDSRPRASRDPKLFYLPGAEIDYLNAVAMYEAGRFNEALAELRALVRKYPDVPAFRSSLGIIATEVGGWEESYRLLKPLVEQGMMDTTIIPSFGAAALSVGQLDFAERILKDSLNRFPGHEEEINMNLGTIAFKRALDRAIRSDIEGTAKHLGEADRYFAFQPHDPAGRVATTRRKKLAAVRGLQADVAVARKEYSKARPLFEEAWKLGPDVPGAEAWRIKVGQMRELEGREGK